ncbi:MAG: pilus assembly protein PilP [Pseudomonadota bacterium]
MTVSHHKLFWLKYAVNAILAGKSSVRAWFKIVTLGFVLAGCSTGNHSDLQQFIKDVNARPAGRISPMPEIIPYDAFVYGAHELRSPFKPVSKAEAQGEVIDRSCDGSVTPNLNRRKEELEGYSLESLSMKGTWNQSERSWVLIEGSDKKLYRAQIGNHIGLNYGVITDITDTEIKIREIISDGQGCYEYRPTRLSMVEQ